jgi:ribosome recycling factor
MQAALEHLCELFRGIGTSNKPDPGMLRSLVVKIEADHLPLEDTCLVSVVNGILKVQPYDRSWLPAVYEAIKNSKLGVFPEKTKDSILVKFPQLTGERRQELVLVVKDLAEKQCIAIRNIRREARKALPDAAKQIEEVTASFMKEIDETVDSKIKKLTTL